MIALILARPASVLERAFMNIRAGFGSVTMRSSPDETESPTQVTVTPQESTAAACTPTRASAAEHQLSIRYTLADHLRTSAHPRVRVGSAVVGHALEGWQGCRSQRLHTCSGKNQPPGYTLGYMTRSMAACHTVALTEGSDYRVRRQLARIATQRTSGAETVARHPSARQPLRVPNR